MTMPESPGSWWKTTRCFRMLTLLLAVLCFPVAVWHLGARYQPNPLIYSTPLSNADAAFDSLEFDWILQTASEKQVSAQKLLPPECPTLPENLLRTCWHLTPNANPPSWQELSQQFLDVVEGAWRPAWCRQRQRVAVLVPYRDRELHLRRLLPQLHRLLRLQAADYRIYLVEQTGRQTFNKGSLFNIGYKLAVKEFNPTCLILHDVDMVPEVSLNLYRCSEQPRLLASAINKFKYRMPYPTYFGGVVAVSVEHFKQANGFSNKFFGWGSEDDNFRLRLVWAGLKPTVTPLILGRYSMAVHKRDSTNQENKRRFKIFDENRNIWRFDGINSVRFETVCHIHSRLFRHIRVTVKGSELPVNVRYSLLMQSTCSSNCSCVSE